MSHPFKPLQGRMHRRFSLSPLALALAGASMLSLLPGLAHAQALPSGMTVVHGQANAAIAGNRMTVTNSNGAILNWRSFSIGSSQGVRFDQPTAASQVLNRVTGSDPSSILGSLSSNGKVWLLNPHGVLFGAGARVDVAGLVASSLSLSDADFLAGRQRFTQADAAAAGSVVNQGELRTSFGGRVVLLASAAGVRNEGLIEAPGGQVLLAAGRSIDLIDTGAPNLTVRVTAPQGEALNLGSLSAAGGRIDLQAAIVNQQGIVRADALETDAAGEVVLRGSHAVNLASGSTTSASGGSGGHMVVDSQSGTTLVQGDVRAVGNSGAGGDVRVLGRHVGVLDGATLDASGRSGGGEVRVGGGLQGKDASVPNAEAAYVAKGSTLLADATGKGDGGRVIVWGDRATRAYGSFSAAGGPEGGNGGLIETSGGWVDPRPVSIRTTAPKGRSGGWLIDPNNITITSNSVTGESGITGGPDFTTTGNDAIISTQTIEKVLNGGDSVTVSTGTADPNSQAGDITMQFSTISVAPARNVSLTLRAHRNIFINGSVIENTSDAAVFNVNLSAAGNGTNGAVKLVESEINTRGGDISIGGAGKFRDTAVWAVGYDNDDQTGSTHGIDIVASKLNAGAGKLTLNGASVATGDASGVRVDSLVNCECDPASALTAGNILINGEVNPSAESGSGVSFRGSVDTTTITATTFGVTSHDRLEFSNTNVAATGRIDLRSPNVSLSNNAILSSTASGDAITVANADNLNLNTFFNTAGSGALSTPNGRWLIYATDLDPDRFDAGGLPYAFKQYNALFSDREIVNGNVVTPQDGNGLLFSVKPTVSLQGNPAKVYDGTTAGSLPGSSVEVTDGLLSGDFASVADTVFGNYADKNAGSRAFTVNGTGSISFFDSNERPVYGYSLGELAGTIARKTLGAPTVSAQNKAYDGNTSAVVSAGSLSGLVGSETLTVDLSGNFDNKNVGIGKTVTVGISLADGSNGGLAANYSLAGITSTLTTTADITQRILTPPVVSASDKTYDGNRLAAVTFGPLGGFAGEETVVVNGTGLFDTKDAGIGKTVTVGAGLADGSNGGLASNYRLANATLTTTASITPKFLTLTGVSASNKTYDGNTSAAVTLGSVAGLVDSEQLVTAGSGQFDDKNAGTGKTVTVALNLANGANGGLASNYELSNATATTTASITPKPLTLSSVSASNKIYDGNTSAAVTFGPLSGLVGSEQLVTTGSGQFDNKNAGTGKAVTVALNLANGADGGLASNYTLASPVTTTADISNGTLSYVANPAISVVGAPLPPFSGSVTGFVAEDTLNNATTGTLAFSSPAKANSPIGNYAILGSGLAASNYVFTQAAANATALSVIAPVTTLDQEVEKNLTESRQAVVVPVVVSTPTQGRVLDVLQALQWGPSNDWLGFRPIPVAEMSEEALSALLASRDSYKKQLFAEAIAKLETDPTLADAPGCQTAEQVQTGRCLITDSLKREIIAARTGTAANVAQAEAPAVTAPTPTPAAPAAVTQAVAPEALIEQAPTGLAALSAPVKRRVKTAALPQIQRKLALLIGVDNYADKRIPRLDNAVRDARSVAALLESSLGYETVVVEDGTKESIIKAMNNLAADANVNDSVVIYYAGHGEMVSATGLGYWQPANADPTRPQTWLSNTDIERLLGQIGASQVALISDSCYSGSLVSGSRIRGTTGTVDPIAVLSRKAVVVMSSGGNEPVFDAGKQGHSPFAYNLMQTLQQVADWQIGGNVFERVRFAVAKELPQRPQYGSSATAGHQPGSDYLFEQRQLDPAR